MPITRDSYDRFSSNEESNGFVEEPPEERHECQTCGGQEDLINGNWLCLSITCPSGAGKF